jgi:hypothetical protein
MIRIAVVSPKSISRFVKSCIVAYEDQCHVSLEEGQFEGQGREEEHKEGDSFFMGGDSIYYSHLHTSTYVYVLIYTLKLYEYTYTCI